MKKQKKFKDENQLLYFEETSAKTGLNTNEVFIESAKLLYEEYKRYKRYYSGIKLKKYDNPNPSPDIICFK